MTNKSELITFTILGMQLFKDQPKYNSKYSNRLYTNQQKHTILLLKQRFNVSYDTLIDFIKGNETLVGILELNFVPHSSTIKKFAKTISCVFLHKKLRECLKLIKEKDLEVAIDATGFRLQDGSVHYRKRLGLPSRTRKFLKNSAVVETDTQLIISCEIHKNHRSDYRDVKSTINRAMKAGKIILVTADKGYDAEWVREYVIEDVGAECQIPIRGTLGKHPGHYRKKFVMVEAIYHKRSKVETVFGVIKKVFGEIVRAKDWLMQKKELLFRAICYNLYRVVKVKRVSP